MNWKCRLCNCEFVKDEVCITCGAEKLYDATVKSLQEEVERLKKKCDMQANILRRLTPDKYPDTMFISGVLGERDFNNMPQKLLVVPAYGVDFSYIYERTEKTTGPEW